MRTPIDSTRRAASIAGWLAASVTGWLVAAGCGGASVGGNDSETHFSCSSAADCVAHGARSACIRGTCVGDPRGASLSIVPDAATPLVPAPESGAPLDASSDAAPAQLPDANGDAGVPALVPSATFNVHIVGWESHAAARNAKLALLWGAGGNPKIFESYQCADGYAFTPIGHLVQATVIRDLGGGHFEVDAPEPPAEAFDPDVNRPNGDRMAWGQFVAYSDGNGNDALDFARHDTTSPDEVFGLSSPFRSLAGTVTGTLSYTVVYTVKGTEPPPSPPPFPGLPDLLPTIPPGYSIYLTDYRQAQSSSATFISAATEIPVVFGRSIAAKTLVCADACFNNQFQLHPTCPDSPADLPKTGIATCTDTGAGMRFDWSSTVCDGCNCKFDGCSYYPSISDAGVARTDLPCGTTESRIDYDTPP